MNKEAMTVSLGGAASGAGILNSVWMWIKVDPSAHVMTMLTGALIASQLFWGWKKFFKGGA